MRHILLLAMVTLSLSSFADEFYKGENLITPYELDPDKWEVLMSVEGSLKSLMWKSKEKGMADAYVINIQGGNRSKLNQVRKIQDDPGRKSCQSFESIDLELIPDKNYKSVMWRTVCMNGKDFKAQILQLAIKGRDNVYHLQKIWRGDVSKEEMENWAKNFREVYVCDTRKKEKQCPVGYGKVKNV
ncbi:hypothetical protein [Microbulbifer variabilis]|uniref:hypothetical protein n=1 Tax=Microbulbifer variabilis TaxID=266805 RepID=UPI001CFC7AAA|nr:hypothetical protein [Microbulbifer variabilis]